MNPSLNSINDIQVIDKILYTFQIEPIITKGNAGADGKYIQLNDGQIIDSINFDIVNNNQKMTLYSNGYPVTGYDEIKFGPFNITNNIFNPVGQYNFTCYIDNSTTGTNYNLNNPILDIIRNGDIFRAYYQSIDDASPTQLCVGTIENVLPKYNNNGLVITFTVGYLTNILARSQLIQTNEQNLPTAIAPGQVVFGDFLHMLLSETYINQTTGQTKYYGGTGETIAAGKATIDNPGLTNGSAINANSYVYAITPATDTKLNNILQILYPYQRVAYIDTDGNLIITPLSTYFDTTENWSLGMNGEFELIPCESMEIHKNTTVLQNRSYCAMNQAYISINQSGSTTVNAQANTAVALATPPQEFFPRAYDFVQSGLGLQTAFSIQAFDSAAYLQNSGLLNTGYGYGSITGVTSVMEVNNNNEGYSTVDKEQNKIKYAMSLYASRSLAESLVNDLLIDISMPTVVTYSETLGRFRKIPLNQMVNVPPVTNNLYDGLQSLFCYGFSLSYDPIIGSTTTLNLCKPYVFTGFWADELVEI